MEIADVVKEVHATWRAHNDILVYLLEKIPQGSMSALPAGSRGRDVAAQFMHLHKVRIGWLRYHTTGERPEKGRYDKTRPPTKTQLAKALRESGAAVEQFLEDALLRDVKPRMFGRQALREWGISSRTSRTIAGRSSSRSSSRE
jgi:uncharacterized damage-inducible protein DinB